jgi:hypothetical protein
MYAVVNTHTTTTTHHPPPHTTPTLVHVKSRSNSYVATEICIEEW